MYLHKKISTMYLFCSYCIVLLLLRWDTGKVRGRFSGSARGQQRAEKARHF